MVKRYTGFAIFLHWLMAILIIGLMAVGFYMSDLPLSPFKLKIYSWHKWAGVIVFALLMLRVLWRLTHRPPELPASMAPLMRLMAHAGHGALYLLMLAIPLSGWLMSSAKGITTVFFGLWPLPDLLSRDLELAHTLGEVHEFLNVVLIITLVGHVAAALKHHFVDRDDVLIRMMPHGK